MDTIYTPEFAEAGWMKEMTGADKQDALDDVLPGPAASVTWKNKVYGIPTNTNVQLLWYRKDLVPTPPKTWDEMIAMAKKLPAGEGNILEQGQKYEGYVVWFNNLVASARRHDRQRRRASRRSTRTRSRPRTIIHDVATSGRADPSLSTAQEDQGRLAFEAGKGAFLLNWPYVWAAGHADAKTNKETAKVVKNMGYAAYPSRQSGPAEPRLDRRRQPRHPEERQEPGARHEGRALHDSEEVPGARSDQRGPAAGHELGL